MLTHGGRLGRTFVAVALSLVLVADLATVATAQEVGPPGREGQPVPQVHGDQSAQRGRRVPGDPEGQRDPKVRPASREHGDCGVQPAPGESPVSPVRT